MVMLMCVTMTACGGDDDEPGSSKGVRAYSATYTISGTKVEFYVSLNDKEHQGKIVMFYNNEHTTNTFYYNPDGYESTTISINGYSYHLSGGNGSSSTIYIYGQGEGYNLSKVDIKSYWQSKYDEAAQKCRENYYDYLNETVRFPWLSLEAAQNMQKNMKFYREMAAADGVTITTSEWETKDLN